MKISDTTKSQIFAHWFATGAEYHELAKHYNVSLQTVRFAIINGMEERKTKRQLIDVELKQMEALKLKISIESTSEERIELKAKIGKHIERINNIDPRFLSESCNE